MIARGLALALILACGGAATAQDSSMCQYAIHEYNNTVEDVSSRIQRYGSCVSGSAGSDDCSSEFRRLRTAQSSFESAVSSYQIACPPL